MQIAKYSHFFNKEYKCICNIYVFNFLITSNPLLDIKGIILDGYFVRNDTVLTILHLKKFNHLNLCNALFLNSNSIYLC